MASGRPYLPMAEATWTASSRVGTRTIALTLRRSALPAMRCKSGSANAAVLPVPGAARPTMSRPAGDSALAPLDHADEIFDRHFADPHIVLHHARQQALVGCKQRAGDSEVARPAYAPGVEDRKNVEIARHQRIGSMLPQPAPQRGPVVNRVVGVRRGRQRPANRHPDRGADARLSGQLPRRCGQAERRVGPA